MALEQTEIIDKLKTEGINEKLGVGLSFETADELNSWVNEFKTTLPENPKKLEDYTKEELEELAKDPTFKGAKGLQGFIDSVRQKGKKTEIKVEGQEEVEPLWAKNLREKFEQVENERAVDAFDKTVERIGKEEKLNDKQIQRIKKGLSNNATEAEIKKEITDFKLELAELGIRQLGTPGGGAGTGLDAKNSLSKKYAEKNKKKT